MRPFTLFCILTLPNKKLTLCRLHPCPGIFQALRQGYLADVVVFDPATIQDHATFDGPQQYATGVVHVFVNGTQVLSDGDHTGAKPGRVVRGPGWKGRVGVS